MPDALTLLKRFHELWEDYQFVEVEPQDEEFVDSVGRFINEKSDTL